MAGADRAASGGASGSHRPWTLRPSRGSDGGRRWHPRVAPGCRMSAEAIQRLALYFGTGATRQAYLARQALGRPLPGDPRLAERLRQELAAGVRTDGTVSGGAVPTIWRVHELLDLGYAEDSSAITRPLAWMLALQDRPGAFHDGC